MAEKQKNKKSESNEKGGRKKVATEAIRVKIMSWPIGNAIHQRSSHNPSPHNRGSKFRLRKIQMQSFSIFSIDVISNPLTRIPWIRLNRKCEWLWLCVRVFFFFSLLLFWCLVCRRIQANMNGIESKAPLTLPGVNSQLSNTRGIYMYIKTTSHRSGD